MLPQSIKPRFFDTLSNTTGRYIKPTPYHKASGLTKEIYEQVIEEFFINGPLTTHAVSTQVLAGVWMAEREILLTDQFLTREDKEALGVTFSQVNECSYCEDLINSVVYGAEQGALAEQLRYRQQNRIHDEATRNLHEWAMRSYDTESRILSNPPFGMSTAPEIIGTALIFNYFNRYVKVFFSGTPLMAPFRSNVIKSALYRLTGVELRESVLRRLKPGRALRFLPDCPLPDDMTWASSNPCIAAAVSRWAKAIEQAAQGQISENVRKKVEEEVASWRGEARGLSRSWLDPVLIGMSESEAAVARLALLTALSPSQMSDDVVENFRKRNDSDEALVTTVAWAAFIASRRVAGWLADQGGLSGEVTADDAA